MASSSNTKDADNFQSTDDESDDITYEMSVEGFDSDSDSDSDLFEYVDNETEETLLVEYEQDDPFLYELCEPHLMISKIDDNEKDHEAINIDDIIASVENDSNDVENAYQIHDPKHKWKLMKPSLGGKYENLVQLKFCVTDYAIANGLTNVTQKELWLDVGQKGMVRTDVPLGCMHLGLTKKELVQVKILDDNHICPINYAQNSLAKPNWIAQTLLPILIKNQDMSLKEMKKHIFDKYLCNVSLGQCRRGKTRVIHQIEGSLAEHYGRVWDYGGEIIRSNPGSTIKIIVEESDNGNYFKGFYVCFKALKDGCKPVIELDGCFLKSICKGDLLTAIGRDANNQVYPIAWAVYDIENKDNWSQFIKFLANDLELSHGAGLDGVWDCFLNSKSAFGFDEAGKIYCHKLSIDNVQDIRLFWSAAMSPVKEEFESHMLELKQISKDAYNHLIQRNPSSWCRAFFEKDRACEAVENGICESFNKMILGNYS
ncbi:hypothetical protein OSB04_026705 [Centaurea solstitialis]|uniref:MULE transposase domain-containing protein n=1 Tax=Centaurea solstitialis TaxID=347529 RepID=A0AA38W7H8_9ASTR|nr:hypothetical protein OSB04_026705 [Centaurea solstitialis]